jgi:hypothetical protein
MFPRAHRLRSFALRHFGLLLMLVATASAALPPELEAALKTFRSEPPREWSFTQTTVAEGKSTVERCNAARPEFDRWSLIQKDGRAPTPDELRDYGEGRSRRSRTGTAPNIVDQFDLASIETVSDAPDRASYRFRLRRGETRDNTAPHLRATVVLHKPGRTIESIELASAEEFSPTFGVKIAALKTTMTYSLPRDDIPSLPQTVATHLRGRAFLFKSLDAEMLVTFSNYERVPRK